MLSDDLANLSELVLGEERIPRRIRADLAREIAIHAEAARALLECVVPMKARPVPPGCVDLAAVRAMRQSRGAA